MTIETVETNERVDGIDPDLTTRLRWRAERRKRKLNRLRSVPFYRWEVVPTNLHRWQVVAFQNVARAVKDHERTEGGEDQ